MGIRITPNTSYTEAPISEPVKASSATSAQGTAPVAGGTDGLGNVEFVTKAGNVNSAELARAKESYGDKLPNTYLEQQLDKIVKEMFPNMSVKFRVHENSGQIITQVYNNTAERIVREFPAEKILDVVHDICVRMGIVLNGRA